MRGSRPVYTIVLSLDAVGSRDWDYFKHLPNIKRILQQASYCNNVKSIYPTLTYPAHSTIVTGRYPKNHGVINNIKLQPGVDYPDWYWKRKSINGTTLYDEAKAHGLSTASILWPVTGRAKIDWNIPEIWANRPWKHQIFSSLANGSIGYQLKMIKKFGYLLDGTRQPQLDDFVLQAALYTLKHYKPNLMLIHLTDVDTNRHKTGVDSMDVLAALERHDVRIGSLISALKDKEMWQDTALILLGDHSHISVDQVFQPNYFLKKAGLLTVKKEKIVKWRAISQTCDGSCYFYVRPNLKEKEKKAFFNALEEMKSQYPRVIEKIFSKREVRKMGADTRCACMLEAKEGYMFLNGTDTPLYSIDMNSKRPSKMLSAHGFHPDKPSYQTIFVASGAGIRNGIAIKEMSLVDEGPTIARLLGIDLPMADGRAIDEILWVDNMVTL